MERCWRPVKLASATRFGWNPENRISAATTSRKPLSPRQQFADRELTGSEGVRKSIPGNSGRQATKLHLRLDEREDAVC